MERDELISILDFMQRHQLELPDVEARAAQGGTPHRIYDSLSALANREGGGTILFGVDESDGFRVCGVGNPHGLMTQIADLCTTNMSPVIRPEFSVEEIDGRAIVVAEIPGVPVALRPAVLLQACRTPEGIVHQSWKHRQSDDRL